MSKINKTFVDVQPSKPSIGQEELRKQLTYVSRVCKGLYFYIPKHTSPSQPSHLPQILDSDQGVNCTLGAVANKT